MVVRCAVLGAGRIGQTIAATLADDGWQVAAVDPAPGGNNSGATYEIRAHSYDSDIEFLKTQDIVVGALPAKFGLSALTMMTNIVERPYVDVSFMEDWQTAVAMSTCAPVVIDCGVAPGLSNLMYARGVTLLGDMKSYSCAVGGNPVVPAEPWYYWAPFEPASVIAEYTRPAQCRVDGEMVLRPACSSGGWRTPVSHRITDGLRTLLRRVPSECRNMIEYTIRDPEHWKIIDALIHTGLIHNLIVQEELMKAWVRPVQAHGRTDMEVICTGVGGQCVNWTVRDFDTPLASSMARATGFTACAIARYVAEISRSLSTAVTGPESLVFSNAGTWDFIVTYLSRHGVGVVESQCDLPGELL